MALIKCPECGREVSDKAPSCPNCGVPITAGTRINKVPVYFSRPKTMIMGVAITGTVIVDGSAVGSAVGSAGNGDSFEVMLSPGSHNILIESNTGGVMGSKTSNSASLNIPEDAKRVNVTLTTKAANMFGVGAGVIVDDIRVERLPKEIKHRMDSDTTSSKMNKLQKREFTKAVEQQWTCIKCKATNQGKAKFCCECGEPRHFAWKCGNCGETNEAKVKYCFNCGKEKVISEEILPSVNLKSENMVSLESLLPDIEKFTKCSEIFKFIEDKDNIDLSDEKKISLNRELQRIIKLERIYGPLRNDSIRIIKKYITD